MKEKLLLEEQVTKLSEVNWSLNEKFTKLEKEKQQSQDRSLKLSAGNILLEEKIARLSEEKQILSDKVTKANDEKKRSVDQALKLLAEVRLLEGKIAQMEEKKTASEKQFALLQVKADMIADRNGAASNLINSLPEMITQAIMEGMAVVMAEERKRHEGGESLLD
jgi:uncharacterized phage infection (PIP) family protein YhgE